MPFFSLIKKALLLLNSDDTPFQIAIAFTLAFFVGFTPFLSIQNFFIILLAFILNISLKGFFLGLTISGLIYYLLTYPFHYLGKLILIDSSFLNSFFKIFFDAPLMLYTNLNNTIALGGFLSAIILFFPIFILIKMFVAYYRKNLQDKLNNSKIFKIFAKSPVSMFIGKVTGFFTK